MSLGQGVQDETVEQSADLALVSKKRLHHDQNHDVPTTGMESGLPTFFSLLLAFQVQLYLAVHPAAFCHQDQIHGLTCAQPWGCHEPKAVDSLSTGPREMSYQDLETKILNGGDGAWHWLGADQSRAGGRLTQGPEGVFGLATHSREEMRDLNIKDICPEFWEKANGYRGVQRRVRTSRDGKDRHSLDGRDELFLKACEDQERDNPRQVVGGQMEERGSPDSNAAQSEDRWCTPNDFRGEILDVVL